MGYVAAFRKGSIFPPAAVVVTETVVDVLLFPFVKGEDSQRLLTAAHLSFNLWEAPTLAETNGLRLLACIFYAGFNEYMMQYPAAEPYTEMRKIRAISTNNNSIQEQLQAQIEALRRQVAAAAKESLESLV